MKPLRPLLLALVGAALLPPAGALAHARYQRSDPPDRGRVASPPPSVWAEFSEPPAPSSYLRVYDPCGRRVDDGDSQVTAYRVTVTMDGSAAGTYRVDWAVLSTLDGHTTTGTFTFTSTGGAPCGGDDEERDPATSAGGDGGGARRGQTSPPSRADGSREPAADGDAGTGAGGGDARPGAGNRGRGAGRGARGDSAATTTGGGEITARGTDEPSAPLARGEPPPGLPLDGLLLGLVLAALIGAAGGYVYAGIMGSRR